MLAWNDADVAACLEVLPSIDEDGVCYSYAVEKDGLRLELAVFPYDGEIALMLYRDAVEAPVFSLRLIDCQAVRYVTDRDGECLEFAPAKCFGGRFDDLVSIPYGFRLAVTPSIQIVPFAKAAM